MTDSTSDSTSESTPDSTTDSTLNIAVWLERRLDVTLGFHLPAARLYGIVVNDAERLPDDDDGGAARSSFIEEGGDAYALLSGTAGLLARSFDAAAIVTTGWAAPLGEDGTMTQRASRHPLRRRVRAVAVVDDNGVASVIRFEDDPAHMILQAERGTGDIVDAMEAMWFGDPTALIQPAPVDVPAVTTPSVRAEFVNLRTTRGGCTRRP